MPEHLILVEKAGYSKGLLDDWPVITAGEYLTDPTWQQKKGLRIVNLCRSQKYLGEGYYCSLLAEARSHKIIPSVRTLQHREPVCQVVPGGTVHAAVARLLLEAMTPMAVDLTLAVQAELETRLREADRLRRVGAPEDLGIDRKLPPALACSPETLEQARSRAERRASGCLRGAASIGGNR